MKIEPFFDLKTATYSYVVSDDLGSALIIDPALGYDIHSGKVDYEFADSILKYIQKNQYNIEWILETHVHADHITAAKYIQSNVGGKIGIGEKITEILKYWVPFFQMENEIPLDGRQFDHLFKDEEVIRCGSLEIKAISTPGHTPACMCYRIEDKIFVGDTIFMPYVGTARTDFPGGSAETLFDSIQKLFSYPDTTEIYVGHDYPLPGNQPYYKSTIQEQKSLNILLNSDTSRLDYIKMRNERDQGKPVPKLLYPSIQINLRAGKFPEKGGKLAFLKIPFQYP
jgi:glyoxylase-like metal-dependent hydrolase (beta-lactamase superfamily II)